MANPSQGDEALQRAMGALRSGVANEAERIAADILKKAPRHPQALQVFGCALLMQGRAQDAIPPLSEAARLRHDAEVDTQLAIALRQAGRVEDALSRLKRAIKRPAPYALAFHELGFVLSTLHRHDEAVDALRRGLEIAPMMPELWVQLGNVLRDKRDRGGAKQAFARGLAINPQHPEALFGLAMTHLEDGEYAPAAQHFRAILMNGTDNRSAWVNLGHCLLELGQRDAAFDCFRRVARLDGNQPGPAIQLLVKSARGRFWLRPSAAAKFFEPG